MTPTPSTNVPSPSRERRFFEAILRHPRKILVASAMVVCLGACFLPGLVKDTRSDAFIPPGDASLEARDRVREVFGLSDPIVVAVVAPDGQDVFTPETLALVEWLSDAVESTPGVDGARVTSLATESRIDSSEDGMRIEPFFEAPPTTPDEAVAIRNAVFDFPLYVGSLVSRDASTTLVVAELDDGADAGAVYDSVVRIASEAPALRGERIHVAGEGGVAGHLGAYIDADTRRMVPAALLAITVILTLVFRTRWGVLLPNLVVIGAASVAIGGMAAFGATYTLITPALPVILVAIGVADGIHILSAWSREAERDPEAEHDERIVRTMSSVARPIAVTSVTDAAGFLALAASTAMPPFQTFGIFAAVGVGATFAFSLVTLPAALALLPPAPPEAAAIVPPGRRALLNNPLMARSLRRLASIVSAHSGRVFAGVAGVATIGLASAISLTVDYERVRNFRADEPIRVADAAINRAMDGINYLDVLIEVPEGESLLEPETLARIEALQTHAVSLPVVGGTTSIVDHLKQMNRAFEGGDLAHHRLPSSRAGAAQLLLLAEMDGVEGVLHQRIDAEQRRGLVRIALPTGRFSDETVVVNAVEAHLADAAEAGAFTASLAGRVNVDYRWMRGLAEAHFASVGLALLAVFSVSALLFRSWLGGLLTVLPVSLAILAIYAVMSALDLWLGITTSMFAAIAIGLGVDFAVHLLERIRSDVREEGLSLDEAITEALPTIGRELCFNFACAGLGFGVLSLSSVPTLAEFGLLTLTAVAASFVASLALVPTLARLLRPSFLVGEPQPLDVVRFADLTRFEPRRESAQVINSQRCPAPRKTGPPFSNGSARTTRWLS